jgi:SAM-dependent methyltransferase
MPKNDFVAGQGIKAGLKRFLVETVLTGMQRHVVGPAKLVANRRKAQRYLEIGPGPTRIAGFETLNVVGGPQVDYVCNATARLPFLKETFDIVYASHILEHAAWYRSLDTLREWVRVLKPGGVLEVWVPDGLKIAEAFVAAERTGSRSYEEDGWWRFNEEHDPCPWMAGRIFSYGDGTGAVGHFNWHMAMFSERYLGALMQKAGVTDIRRMNRDEVRGYDHGWINLGISGRKPAAG